MVFECFQIVFLFFFFAYFHLIQFGNLFVLMFYFFFPRFAHLSANVSLVCLFPALCVFTVCSFCVFINVTFFFLFLNMYKDSCVYVFKGKHHKTNKITLKFKNKLCCSFLLQSCLVFLHSFVDRSSQIFPCFSPFPARVNHFLSSCILSLSLFLSLLPLDYT